MAQRQIGMVQALWRYPVKSLRGESLTAATVTEYGLEGDRGWALRELGRGGIMSARVWAAMLQLAARCESEGDSASVRLQLPDGREARADDPSTARILSELFGREIRLERVRRVRPTATELEAIIRGDTFPPARDFFDEDVLHIVASGTLAHLRRLSPASDFDARRFRANIYVDTGDEADCFVEDQWLDGQLVIGDALIGGLRPAIRCVMTTHPQSELPRDIAVLRTAAQHHQAYVGVFASVTAPGTIRVGDAVVLAN